MKQTMVGFSSPAGKILNGAKCAKSLGLGLITLSGFDEDNPLRALGDLNFWVDSPEYNIVETTHQTWLLAAVDYVISKEERAA